MSKHRVVTHLDGTLISKQAGNGAYIVAYHMQSGGEQNYVYILQRVNERTWAFIDPVDKDAKHYRTSAELSVNAAIAEEEEVFAFDNIRSFAEWVMSWS